MTDTTACSSAPGVDARTGRAQPRVAAPARISARGWTGHPLKTVRACAEAAHRTSRSWLRDQVVEVPA